MSSNIDEKKLAKAKSELACHIQAPDPSRALGGAGGPQADFIDENGKVLLTRMTAAGG